MLSTLSKSISTEFLLIKPVLAMIRRFVTANSVVFNVTIPRINKIIE